jgi:hypothetical protein
MQDEVFMIGDFDDDTITFADFIIDGERVIPLFSDRAAFDRQTQGSGFEKQGLLLKVHFLLSMLRGDELFILNPGDPEPLRLTTADLAHAYAHG